jgi:hypothetical protein
MVFSLRKQYKRWTLTVNNKSVKQWSKKDKWVEVDKDLKNWYVIINGSGRGPIFKNKTSAFNYARKYRRLH